MTLVVWYSDADDADDADDDEDADDDDDDDDEGADDEPFWDVTAAEAIPFAATWLTCQSVTWGIKAQSRGGLAWWDGGYEKGMWLGGRGGGVLSAAPRPVTLGLSGGAGVKIFNQLQNNICCHLHVWVWIEGDFTGSAKCQ